jgi:hypothetical protein
MKTILLLMFVLTGFSKTFSQSVGINTTGTFPDPSAQLDVNATDKGILIPRMTNDQRIAITTPATGLMVYQTNASSGFWYFDGAAWKEMSVSSPAATNFKFFAATSQAINGNTDIKVDFGNQLFLNNASFTNSTFTAPLAGIYDIKCNLYIYGNNAGTMDLEIIVNGAAVSGTTLNIASAIFQGGGFSDNILLAAGDLVSIQVRGSATMAITVGQDTFFTGYKIN